jgi:uncharacterized membrane protein required for colicin V production
MAGFNNLDYIIIVIVALGALYGLGRGVLRMITSLLSLIFGIAAALTWYGLVGSFMQQHFNTSPLVSTVIGYVVVFLVVSALIEFVGRRLIALVYIVHLSWIDRIGGALLGAALGVVVAGISVILLESVVPSDALMVRNSQLAPHVLAYNQVLLGYVPSQVKDLYERKSEDLKRSWDKNNQSPTRQPNGTASGT